MSVEDRNFNLNGIVLRSRDYGDNDRIITFFSAERGKLSAIAKGVRKPQSRLKGAIQPFCQSELAFAMGRGSLYTVTQGEISEPFFSLRSDLTKIAYASYLCELTDMCAPEHKPLRDIYAILLICFTIMEYGGDPRLAARLFELRLLKHLGVAPKLNNCIMCNKPPQYNRFYLSTLRGGLVCENCNGSTNNTVSAGTVQVMRKLCESEPSKLLHLKINDSTYDELYDAVTPYLDYHLDYSSRARRFLQEL